MYFLMGCLAFLLPFVGIASSVSGQWHQTTDHKRWSVEAGSKFLIRPGSDLDLPLITDSRTLVTLFDVKDATSLGTAPAAEVKFNFASRTGQEWEFRTILANWEETRGPFFGPDLSSPFFSPDTDIRRIDYQFDADFYSFELMARRSSGRSGLVWMLGPRLVSSSNTVTNHAVVAVDPGQGAPLFNVTSSSITHAKNTLIGLQAGVEMNQPIAPGLYISGFARAGGYYTPTKVDTSTTDSFTNEVFTTRQTKSSESFMGEAGGRIYMDLVPNVFSVYTGYEANWIDGFAFAPAQLLQFEGAPQIETTNTIFFHGVTFGLKYTY